MALTDFSMRSMDKSLSSLDYCNDIFDQYIDTDVFGFDEFTNRGGYEEFGNFFDFPESLSGTDTASPLQSSIHIGSCAKAALSEPDLLNLNDLFPYPIHATTPIPSSPTSTAWTQSVKGITPNFRRSASCGIRKHIRNFSLSPKMTPISSRRGRRELWTERTESSPQAFSFPPTYSQPAVPSEWTENTSYNAQSSSGAVGWSTPSQHSQESQSRHRSFVAIPNVGHGHSQSVSSVHSPSVGYYSNPLSPVGTSYAPASPEMERTSYWEYEHGPEHSHMFGSPVLGNSMVPPWQSLTSSIQSYNHGYPDHHPSPGYGPSAEDSLPMHGLPVHGLPVAYDSSNAALAHNPYATGSYPLSPPPPPGYARLNSSSSANGKHLTKDPRSPSPGAKSSRSQKPARGHARGKVSQSERPEPGRFVNYTPDDKKKILSGVAKSGSSKTKKRREEEAKERLSREAMELAKRWREQEGGGRRSAKKGDVEDDDSEDGEYEEGQGW